MSNPVFTVVAKRDKNGVSFKFSDAERLKKLFLEGGAVDALSRYTMSDFGVDTDEREGYVNYGTLRSSVIHDTELVYEMPLTNTQIKAAAQNLCRFAQFLLKEFSCFTATCSLAYKDAYPSATDGSTP